jgi:cell fate (sporulation/competence/biofilm development) regulator YlbF (YheA/YmcA/DUF963 family)
MKNVSDLVMTFACVQNKAVMESLFKRAEQMQKHIKKLESGQNLDKDELSEIRALKAEYVTGFSEADRLRSK